ncbi:MAG: DUF6159 family protein [Thermoplasmata archaeon]|nr:DUF6159 family protein [Thermoplasmata archaeon]
MGKISRGWKLTKLSLKVIKKDKEILLLPLISGLVTILLLASFIGGVFISIGFDAVAEGGGTILFLAGLVMFYLMSYFVSIFFNAAIIGCATMRLEGGDPTVKDGLRIAMDNIGRIFLWAVIAATVGVIIRSLQQRVGFIGKLIMGALGITWTLVTYFVVPVLIYEKVGPWAAMKRSASMIRKSWGETVVGTLGLGIIFLLLALPGMLFIIIGAAVGGFTGAVAGLVIAIVYWLILAMIQAAAQSVLVAALYKYANTGEIPSGFEGVGFSSPFAS